MRDARIKMYPASLKVRVPAHAQGRRWRVRFLRLAGPAAPNNQVQTRLMQSAARTLGRGLQVINVTADTEIAPIFAPLVEQQIGAIVVGASVIVRAKRDQILTLAARYGLSTMFPLSLDARAGGLFSYGPEPLDITRQAGVYAGRILKGETRAQWS
jgi:putative ABC transport system substrate-binding protein